MAFPFTLWGADPALADGRKLDRRRQGMDRRRKVMGVLCEAEGAYPGLELSLED
jgi:hypothetical protein